MSTVFMSNLECAKAPQHRAKIARIPRDHFLDIVLLRVSCMSYGN